MKKTLIVGNWETGNETNLRFFSSRGVSAKPTTPAALFADKKGK
jgi:hypothetical protein